MDPNPDSLEGLSPESTVKDLSDDPQATPPSSHQEDEKNLKWNQILAEDGTVVSVPIETIEALHKKLSELKPQANLSSEPAKNVEDKFHLPPKMAVDQEKRRRMEGFLFKHRKKWERDVGPGEWYANAGFFGPNDSDREPYRHWVLHTTEGYRRPDPFRSSQLEDCTDGQYGLGDDAIEDFDHVIDYGNRRERLRKNFEWELDRLWLDEELDRRRREEIEKQKNLEAAGEEEKKMTEDENIGEAAPPTLPDGAMLKLNRVEWGEFIRLSHNPEYEGSVIEILIGEPPIVNNADDRFPFSPFGFFGHRLGRRRKLAHPKDRKPIVPVAPGKGQVPERIRIRSGPLFSILNVLLPNELDRAEFGFSLARPFRSLMYCDSALRAWYRTLEKKFDALDRTSNGSPVTTGDPEVHVQEAGTNVPGADQSETSIIEEDNGGNKTSIPIKKASSEAPDGSSAVEPGNQADLEDEEDDINGFDEAHESTKSRTALEELKCLLSFMDSDILPRQLYLRSSECRKVFFSDLWLIFQPGVEVVSTDGKQAYRVIGVNTVKQGVTRRWESTQAPFSVTCVYIDFDGKNVGPVRKSFDFKKFDGEKDITSLKVYPIQFHQLRQFDCSDSEWEELEAFPADQRFRQKLVRRGAKFFEVATVKHMYYAGPTLETRDDVESQVVVDFESAFSAGDESRDQRKWRPLLEPLIGVSLTEKEGGNDGDEEKAGSDADSFQKPYPDRYTTHDDAYLDEKHSSDYVNSLLPGTESMSSQPSIAVIPRPLAELQAGPGKSLPSEDELVIMSYRVFGFVLRSRKWGTSDNPTSIC